MMLKRFVLGVLLRCVLLLMVLTALASIVGNAQYLFSHIVLVALLVILLVEFFRHITRTNRDLSKFIHALEHEDFSVNFKTTNQGSDFDKLSERFRSVLTKYRENRMDKEAHYAFQEQLLDRLPLGLLAWNDAQEIILCNAKAQALFQIPEVANVSRLEGMVPGLRAQLAKLPAERMQQVSFERHGVMQAVMVIRSKWDAPEKREVFLIQDLKDTMENAESEAWIKLIRILTHEIMNSVTSVSSLSSTALTIARKSAAQGELITALESVQKRSASMHRFVDDYRKLAHVPVPNKAWFPVMELVREQALLVEQSKTDLVLKGSDKIQVCGDRDQIGQGLLNLLLNALHAVKDQPNGVIEIQVRKTGLTTFVTVRDNGHGIQADQLNDVFVPFFSTREGGSGIGLSLSRQIMRNHGGSVSVTSEPSSTCFELRFRDDA